jgi:DNA polymerase IV
MDLNANTARPLTMHIDLNSCFAILEQQANRLYRHKPVAIAAYTSPRGMVIASSYEAKALGIKLGVNVMEAKSLCKDVIILAPDPERVFNAHRRFGKVLINYTDEVTPKSVDEYVIDFSGSPAIRQGWSMEDIGLSIKKDIKDELGEYVTVNVGIGPNRFLAKLAAGLNKPDGMDRIDSSNLREVYSSLELIDLPGINRRYKARLNVAGIYTPLQFLDAPVWKLRKEVFKGIVGYYWYLRLRGYEVDSQAFGRRSFGQQYALGNKTTDKEEIKRLLMKLSEKTGRRLRRKGYVASGICLWFSFENYTFWRKSKDTKSDIYSTQEIYLHAKAMLDGIEFPARVTNMGVAVFKIRPYEPVQIGLFDGTRMDSKSLARSSDMVNDRYGEFTVVPATMANMQDTILKRVAFGAVEEEL